MSCEIWGREWRSQSTNSGLFVVYIQALKNTIYESIPFRRKDNMTLIVRHRVENSVNTTYWQHVLPLLLGLVYVAVEREMASGKEKRNVTTPNLQST